jgi:hypothetical protein
MKSKEITHSLQQVGVGRTTLGALSGEKQMFMRIRFVNRPSWILLKTAVNFVQVRVPVRKYQIPKS